MFDRICLGSAQFGFDYGINNKSGQTQFDDVKLILGTAVQHGINFIDTAQNYGNAETILGYFSDLNLNINTKIDAKNRSVVEIINNIENSFIHVNQEQIYSIMFHDVGFLKNKKGEEIYNYLFDLKEKMKIKKIVVSLYDHVNMDTVFLKYKIDMIQIPYNVFDCDHNKIIFLNTLKDNGIEIHARSIFLQGLLLKTNNDLPVFAQKYIEYFNMFDTFLTSNNLSRYEFCIKHALNNPCLDKIVIGFDTFKQFEYFITVLERITSGLNYPNLIIQTPDELKFPYLWSH